MNFRAFENTYFLTPGIYNVTYLTKNVLTTIRIQIRNRKININDSYKGQQNKLYIRIA